MYDFDSLKNVYENYDIIGHVAYNNKTGQYIDLSNPMYINVLFANLWVFATNYKEEKFNIYNSFSDNSKIIYNTILRGELASLNNDNKLLSYKDLVNYVSRYAPFKNYKNIIKYLYLNNNYQVLFNWITLENNSNIKKLTKAS